MSNASRRISEWLIVWRIPLLLAAAVAAAAAFVPARSLVFDRSIENMFAADDPLIGPYQQLKRTFGGNEAVMAVYVDEDLFGADGAGIRRLAELSEKLKAVPGVKDVISIDQPLAPDSEDKEEGPAAGADEAPDAEPINRIVDEKDPLARQLRDLFAGYTHSTDGRVAAVVCLLVPESETDVSRRTLMADLRAIVEPLPSGMITGEPVMVTDGFRYVEEDGTRLGWATTLLLAAVTVLCFRSIRWTLIPIAVVQLTLLLTEAVLVTSGLRLSMVSSMLTAIVTVVGIAAVVHVIVRFRDARTDGRQRREALLYAGVLLVGPIFWACSTDAVGFASLLVAKVGPVQDFGVMMAIGALLVIVSIAMLVPGLALTGRFDTDPHRAWGEARLDEALDRVAIGVRRWPRTVGIGSLVLTAVAGLGAFRLTVETDFTKNFRASSPIVRSYQFVEENLGGAGMLDVIVPAPKDPDWPYLRYLRHLGNRLRREVVVPGPDGKPVPALTKVLSLADGIVAAAPTDPDEVSFRAVRNTMVSTGQRFVARKMPVLLETLYGEDPQHPGKYYARIMLRARERQPSEQKRQIIEQVERIAREQFPAAENRPAAEVTGMFVLLTSLIDSMVRDQWYTFGVAIVGIGLMMLLAFRNPLVALAAIVPNVMPILIVTGLMGWAGLKINMGAAMIAAVSMGLSIDSSIHYIAGVRRGLAAGQPFDEALALAHQSVGRAIVFSTLALIVGFSVLCVSEFVPTIYFGILVGLSMLGGMVGNLVVLPLLLRLILRERARQPA